MSWIADRLQQPDAIRIEFQPIVHVQPDHVALYAIEALTRGPRGTSVERPEVLFEYARRKGIESAVDLQCIDAAFTAWKLMPGQPLLSVNVHGATLAGVDRFAERILTLAGEHGLPPNRLMFELIEFRSPWVIETFLTTLDELRAAGVRIAVDDLGVGASNYQMIVDCRPDHIKIDRHVIQGCSQDRWRRAVLESIATLGRSSGARPIAEGVETIADLETLLDVGIDTVQGWLYARCTPPEELARHPLFAAAPPQQLKGNHR